MKNIYVYPSIKNDKYKSFNPYISNLYDSISPYVKVVNKDYTSNAGIFNMISFLPRLNYLWFNWIEDIPDKKGGLVQTMVLISIIYYCKLRSIKIIWTLHNKFSHYKRNKKIKEFLLKLLMTKSDFILTHSTEGVAFAESFNVKARGKVKFIHHPFHSDYVQNSCEKITDILIWGSIIAYKGIDKFLEYLKEKKLNNEWKIRIIGKIPDQGYKEKILAFANEKILIEEKFVSNEELKNEIAKSKCVLFTYLRDSVLSSGAVMDTLALGGNVIGPNCGAFYDLKQDGIIETYENFEELTSLLNNLEVAQKNINSEKIKSFVKENKWENFGKTIGKWLNF